MFTLAKLSSYGVSAQRFPIICTRCEGKTVRPIAEGTQVREDGLLLVLECVACRHGWLARVTNEAVGFRPKPDRRVARR